MKFYNLQCEVPGGFGTQTIFNKQSVPWEIEQLNVVFDGWLGGNILALSSAILITDSLKSQITPEISGIQEFQDAIVERSDIFESLQSKTVLPKFTFLKVGDQAFFDDIALARYDNLYNQLIISERFKIILDKFELGNHRLIEIERDESV